jgi:hypothetical protein
MRLRSLTYIVSRSIIYRGKPMQTKRHEQNVCATGRREKSKNKQRVKQEQVVDELRPRHDDELKARIERTRAVTAAWQNFLTANRARFKQIELIKDSRTGDYDCLRMRNMLWHFVAPFKRSGEVARQKAEASTYLVRDSISDDFVRWLNSHSLFDRADWIYGDLQSMDTNFSIGCLSPEQAWRANRYQNPVGYISSVIVAPPM